MSAVKSSGQKTVKNQSLCLTKSTELKDSC